LGLVIFIVQHIVVLAHWLSKENVKWYAMVKDLLFVLHERYPGGCPRWIKFSEYAWQGSTFNFISAPEYNRRLEMLIYLAALGASSTTAAIFNEELQVLCL
jgi:diacylglycerol kinase